MSQWIEGVDWSKTVFVLLAPDAFARHVAIPILERVIDAGYRPISYRPIHTRPTELDRFYEKNIRTVWDAYRFRCVDLLFAFGPMVAILVEDVLADREGGSHEPLRLLKGESDPMKAGVGTIRGDFRSINQTLSMIHISDTPEDAAYEVSVFLPVDGPLPLLESHDELLTVCRLLTPPAAETRGFDEVLGGFRAKIVLVAWNDLSPAGRDLVRQWESEDGIYRFAEHGAGRTLIEHLQGSSSHPLASALDCEFQPDLAREDLSRIRQLLGAYGADLDLWEELVLTTSMFFRPRRRAVAL